MPLMALKDIELREIKRARWQTGHSRRSIASKKDRGGDGQPPRAHSQFVNRRPRRVFGRQCATDGVGFHLAARNKEEGERVTLEEGSRRRTTEAGTVNQHALTHNLSIDVHDEYSGGSVPLMALEDTALRE